MVKTSSVIYVIRNLRNGKVYVGQTSQFLDQRKSEHIWEFNNGPKDRKLYKAIEKYGIKNFVFEIVCNSLDDKFLNELEVHFIKEFDSTNKGYNMICEGNAAQTIESRKKISQKLKGRSIPWHHKTWETRKKNKLLDPTCYKDPKDYVAKGKENSLSKTYLITYPNGKQEVIKGLGQFCRENDLNQYYFFSVLRGEQRTYKGYSIVRFND
jgi:group I intron endonuclease